MAQKSIGMNYPIKKGVNGYFEMTYDSFSNEKTKLINLLSTMEGERIMQPLFGIGYHKYLFEQITPDLKSNLNSEIRNKIETWLPNIIINSIDIELNPEESDMNTVIIQISFGVVNIPNMLDSITFKF